MSEAVCEAAPSSSRVKPESTSSYPGASPPPMAPEELHRYLLRVRFWRRQGFALPRANFQALALR